MNSQDSSAQEPLGQASKGSTPDFTPELDAYEHRVAARIGAVSAHEARLELAAHLDADFEARIEMGIAPEAARLQALAALGDPRRIARSESMDVRTRIALLCGPVALVGGIASLVANRIDGLDSLLLGYGMLLGPATVLGLWLGLGRGWPNLRAFAVGWLAAFGISALPLGVIYSVQGPWYVVPEGLAVWGGFLALPGVAGMLFGKAIGALVRMPGDGKSVRAHGLMRLLAPLVTLGLVLTALQLQAPWLGTLGSWAEAALVVIGMRDRRRLDARSIAVGVTLTVSAFLLWCALPGKGFAVRMEDQLRIMPGFAVTTSVTLLVLQTLALGFWTLVHRFVPRGRAA